jgi:hypothetical protein
MIYEKINRLLISFTVLQIEFGFEELYGELFDMRSQTERVQHVQRVLFETNDGKARSKELARNPPVAHQRGIKLTFGVTERNLVLNWLFAALLPLQSAFERNQYVRRLLYEAYAKPATFTKSVPATHPVTQSLESSIPQVTHITEVAQPSLRGKPKTPEELATQEKKRAEKHKQNATSIGSTEG